MRFIQSSNCAAGLVTIRASWVVWGLSGFRFHGTIAQDDSMLLDYWRESTEEGFYAI